MITVVIIFISEWGFRFCRAGSHRESLAMLNLLHSIPPEHITNVIFIAVMLILSLTMIYKDFGVSVYV